MVKKKREKKGGRTEKGKIEEDAAGKLLQEDEGKSENKTIKGKRSL